MNCVAHKAVVWTRNGPGWHNVLWTPKPGIMKLLSSANCQKNQRLLCLDRRLGWILCHTKTSPQVFSSPFDTSCAVNDNFRLHLHIHIFYQSILPCEPRDIYAQEILSFMRSLSQVNHDIRTPLSGPVPDVSLSGCWGWICLMNSLIFPLELSYHLLVEPGPGVF